MPPTNNNPGMDQEDPVYSQYMMHTRAEIGQVLRAISRQTEMVTAYFNHGQEFFLTAIADVDPNQGRLIVDCGADEAVNARALAAGKILFVTSQDRVKVQFSVSRLERIQHQGKPAFRAPFPAELLKLQRREYYRLAMPMGSPVVCVIPEAGNGRLEVTVADISVGGVGLSGFPMVMALEIGQQFANCRIALAEEGTIASALEVRNIQELTLRNGTQVKRAGCQFIDLPPVHQAMIQRYIIRVDRERRALVRGS